LLGNGSINTFPRKRTVVIIEELVSKQRISKNTIIGVLLEKMFSVGAAPRLYKEDLRPVERIFIRNKPIFSSKRVLHKN
jgi:hypothetical protein